MPLCFHEQDFKLKFCGLAFPRVQFQSGFWAKKKTGNYWISWMTWWMGSLCREEPLARSLDKWRQGTPNPSPKRWYALSSRWSAICSIIVLINRFKIVIAFLNWALSLLSSLSSRSSTIVRISQSSAIITVARSLSPRAALPAPPSQPSCLLSAILLLAPNHPACYQPSCSLQTILLAPNQPSCLHLALQLLEKTKYTF